jgi:hypothetical protein
MVQFKINLIQTTVAKGKEKLTIERLPTGEVVVEVIGSMGEVSVMLCDAMCGSVEIASIVCGTIPTYLDAKSLDRKEWAERFIVNGVGMKNQKK